MWSESILRLAAPVSLVLFFLPVAAAYAEGQRTKGESRGVSERQLRAEERSRAAVGSVCQGCMDQARSQGERQQRTTTPEHVSRQARTRLTRGSSTVWVVPDPLPLTSAAEQHIREVNRSLALEQQIRAHQLQTQFELGQLRYQLQSQSVFRR